MKDLTTRFLIPSVPHTGHRFVQDLMKGVDGCLHRHVTPADTDGMVAQAQAAEGVIIPLRRPALVAESWRRRNQPLEALGTFWDALFKIVDATDPMFLPLDSRRRFAWLLNINHRWGLGLTTDWAPVTDGLVMRETSLTEQEQGWVRDIEDQHLWLLDIYKSIT